MKIVMGSDHAGYRLKRFLFDYLSEGQHEVADLGADSEEPSDYPEFCAAVARAVVRGEFDRGIVLGGTGQGEAMAANKVHGARAALCNDLFSARLAREHNDANVLALGARIVAAPLAVEIVGIFLRTQFEGGRHIPRLQQIEGIERDSRTPII